MFSWRGWGSDQRERFEKHLNPEDMAWELRQFQEEFGDDFGIDQLLKLWNIRATAEIAYAISDAPEYLADQIGLLQNTDGMKTTAKALFEISDQLERYIEQAE